MYEAAVAHYQATGKRNFLDIAIKSADLLCEVFGPGEGQITVAPGHQEVEIGLVKLYRATGDKRYLDLSQFFLESRGKYEGYDRTSEDRYRSGAYWQDHKPVVEQDEAVGHAVRAAYMYSAMSDIAALKGDNRFVEAVGKLWDNVVGKKMYITGGIGSTRHGEAFGKNYELPNATAYCETCASIANCMWNLRMFMLHGDAKYIDVLERSLYNGVLSGISLDGKKFFYPNVLECDGNGSDRSEWFDCSCCPSNLARFIPSVPGYVYAVSDKGIYVNLYASNNADVTLPDGSNVKLGQSTGYPWDGKIHMTITPDSEKEFAVMMRIPGWAGDSPVPSDLYAYTGQSAVKPSVSVNGTPVDYELVKGYAVIKNKWKAGDVIDLDLPMEARTVKANPNVEANVNHLAIERGPIVYCAEGIDNKGEVLNYLSNPGAGFSIVSDTIFGGANILKGTLERIIVKSDDEIETKADSIALIPYYGRSHRGASEMIVWMPTDASILKDKILENARVTDKVFIGREESEKAHRLKGKNTNTGGPGTWRDASDGGWFSYAMKVDPVKPMEVVLTYSSTDGGNREFEILVDGVKIGEQKLRPETFSTWIDRSYAIPENLTKGKKEVTVKVQALPRMIAGGVFGCRVQKQKK